ncbi:3901_t:CDS:2 [Rhizophagus irregularis]|nr:3901_t:CDS:2 [Rhizophagus irregularis]
MKSSSSSSNLSLPIQIPSSPNIHCKPKERVEVFTDVFFEGIWEGIKLYF